MIGLLVITHSNLAGEFLRAAEMIVGPVPSAEAISVDRSFSLDTAKDLLAKTLERLNTSGDGVLILTDMFGGTPTNIAADFLEAGTVEILTGVNLPMIIKFVSARQTMSLEDLSMTLKQYGQQNIIRPADFLDDQGERAASS
ncbi:MAG: PTS system fructose subfamily IIA component [Desulfuromonas sp.]|nr:MAG: PTS system fructose subfamily IIA component [Desulfuromonas sp.]